MRLLAGLASFGVESDKQFVSYSDADDFRWFSGGAETLLEGDEVWLVASDHTADQEQDVSDRSPASAYGAFALVLA